MRDGVAILERVDPGAGAGKEWNNDKPPEGCGQSALAVADVGAGNAEDSVEYPPVLENQGALFGIHNHIDSVQCHGHSIRCVF